MRPFWVALMAWREQGNTKVRSLSSAQRRAIEALQGARPKKHCTWCAKPVSGRRTRWCGDACISAYCIACNMPEFVDRAVWVRDHGVCCMCGIDTEELKRSVYDSVCEDFDRSSRRLTGFAPAKLLHDQYTVRQASDLLMWLNSHRLYDIDHIVAVHLGGGVGYLPGIQNLRTLCKICHKHVSAKQTRQRAQEKKC